MPTGDPSEEDFAALLKRYREASGMNQYQLAEKIGYHGTVISKWEQRDRYPTSHDPAKEKGIEKLMGELAKALDLTGDKRTAFLEAWRRGGQRWRETHPPKGQSVTAAEPVPRSSTPSTGDQPAGRRDKTACSSVSWAR